VRVDLLRAKVLAPDQPSVLDNTDQQVRHMEAIGILAQLSFHTGEWSRRYGERLQEHERLRLGAEVTLPSSPPSWWVEALDLRRAETG
jgi:hypothetical protein